MEYSSTQREIDQIRFKALYDLSRMISDSRQDILDFALEAGVKMTDSEIGYIYLSSEDETELFLHAWSKNVMPQCSIESYPDSYKVSETGLWGEAVRQRRPVITNDYDTSPFRRGYPKGHVPVKRHMNLPVIDNGKIVLIAGVGNKTDPYTDEDVQQLSLIMDGMWNILKRKQTEEELIKSNEQLKKDLIERRRLEQELRQAYKMESMGTLASGIAHDFNNILASVIGFTELTLAEIDTDSTAHSNLTQVLSAGLRARELVKQILTFSRQDETDPTPVLLRPLAKEVLKLIRVSLPSIIRINHHIKGNPLIMADPIQIHQVLMNLCTNAGHAMQEKGGTLQIEIESLEIDRKDSISAGNIEPGPYVCLTVSDTGCGMAPDVRQRIFDPFFTTKERGTGTGMGLSVVHGIVTGFGGNISVFSEPGKGTSFKLFFPAIERRSEDEKRKAAPLARGSEHIFLIDDEQPIVQMNRQFLTSMGYRVSSCTSSLEALEVFRQKKNEIDLILSDTDMPDLTGLQLAEKFIALKPEIPIILCSGFSSTYHRQYAEKIGVRAFLSKPVLTRELSKTIRNVLDRTSTSSEP